MIHEIISGSSQTKQTQENTQKPKYSHPLVTRQHQATFALIMGISRCMREDHIEHTQRIVSRWY